MFVCVEGKGRRLMLLTDRMFAGEAAGGDTPALAQVWQERKKRKGGKEYVREGRKTREIRVK